MENKIFEEFKKKEKEFTARYNKKLDVIDGNIDIESRFHAKNIDMLIILSNMGIIEKNGENLRKLEEFNKCLFKLGIRSGVIDAKLGGIHAIQDGKLDFDELRELDPERYTVFDFEPDIIQDIQEAFS